MHIHQLSLRIKNIRQETADTFSYMLEEISGKTIVYKAGQFLTLLLNIHGKEVRRSYSLSSAPGVDKDLVITIRRVVNGEASRYIIDNLQVGDIVHSLAPSGRFTIDDETSMLCFITAGSGITPVYSLIKYVLQHHPHQAILLINQNRNKARAIFTKTLHLLQEGYSDRFTIIELYSQPTEHEVQPQRLNNYLLEQLVLRNIHTKDVRFYVCGPKPFMRMAEFTLKVMGYPGSTIKSENFEVIAVPPPSFQFDETPRQVTLIYKGEQATFTTAYPNSILQSALLHQIHLPYSCRGGRCSTCTVKLLQGKVFMAINEVLTDKDIADGLVLTCVGYAETDVVISVD